VGLDLFRCQSKDQSTWEYVATLSDSFLNSFIEFNVYLNKNKGLNIDEYGSTYILKLNKDSFIDAVNIYEYKGDSVLKEFLELSVKQLQESNSIIFEGD
jgi:hypothetical protein